MKEPFVFLCPEITREDAYTLIRWLNDSEVTKYLSDPQNVSNKIEQVVQRTNLPVLTHLFNQDGRFFMIYNKQNRPVGFVRLVKMNNDYEIVIVIGDRDNWGKKLGSSAIRESLKHALFELRAQKVIAKIHKDNKRSIKAFVKNGFDIVKENNSLKTFAITLEQFLLLNNGESVRVDRIYITETDMERLKKTIESVQSDEVVLEKYIQDLEQEINRAIVVDSSKIYNDVITMNSRVLLDIDDEEMEIVLAYPDDADQEDNMMSVLSPIGTAILGYNEGSVIEWEGPSGEMIIYIKEVIYQPEAAGDYHM